jgi:hypothetical protein
LASAAIFVEDRVSDVRMALRWLRTTALLILFVPFFGLGGVHFRLGGSGRKGLRNWMSYDLRNRRLLVQRTEGRTVFNYYIFDVGPITYLRLTEDDDFDRLLNSGAYAFERVWRWAWDGKQFTPRRAK